MKVIRASSLPYVPASHEDPRKPGAMKKILFQKADLQPGHFQMLNWAKIAPGQGFNPHYHEDMQEVFIIVSGTGEMTIGGERETLERGDTVLVSAGQVHEMRNTGSQDLEYLVFGISTGTGGKTVIVGAAADR